MAPASPAPSGNDDDDRTIGRILSRREVLTLLGSGAGATLLAACVPQALSSASALASGSAAASATATATASATAAASGGTAVPSCVMVPELTEGPYYVDGVMERADIRTDPEGGAAREGATLELTFAVARVNDSDCSPFEGAVVDVWHCDALGEYSGVSGAGQSDQSAARWLRGYQVTDANGLATFTTSYPGWYSGRAVHIHFKVRTNPASNSGAELPASSSSTTR